MDDRSIIVIGSKGDIPAIVSEHRARLGPCYTVSPLNEPFPGISGFVNARFNPMDILLDPAQPADDFGRNARSLAESIIFHDATNSEGNSLTVLPSI